MQADSVVARELRHHYLFSALSEAQRARVLEHAQTRGFAAGEHLFDHGDRAAHFFLVRNGSVKLYRLSRDGHEKSIAPGLLRADLCRKHHVHG